MENTEQARRNYKYAMHIALRWAEGIMIIADPEILDLVIDIRNRQIFSTGIER